MRHEKQKSVVITPKVMLSKIISKTNGDGMTGHESKSKTRKNTLTIL
jgi:hypothetical protein